MNGLAITTRERPVSATVLTSFAKQPKNIFQFKNRTQYKKAKFKNQVINSLCFEFNDVPNASNLCKRCVLANYKNIYLCLKKKQLDCLFIS